MELLKLRTEPRDRLRVYLNDHLAGAVAGIQLAKRSRQSNAGTPLAADLDRLVPELEEDQAALRGLMADLDLPEARPKQLAAMAAEWVGRLKLNGQLVGYSPLSRLVELEGLCAGVDAKRSLWLSLREVQGDYPVVGRLDLERLIGRAEEQRQTLEEHRRAAAADALRGSGDGGTAEPGPS